MTQPDIIQIILKDSNYHLDLFDTSEIQRLRQRIEGKKTPITYCPIRGKAVQLKPEELIRQLYVERLLNRYHYPRERVRFEHLVNFGREKKRADIVILDKDRADTPYIILKFGRYYRFHAALSKGSALSCCDWVCIFCEFVFSLELVKNRSRQISAWR